MGDPACDRRFCPECDLAVSRTDDVCPDCGAPIDGDAE
jgi:predicted amidophosphoribosyltransferase